VLGASLGDARLAADKVPLLEAHGTGTALGDPIETGAVAAVFVQRMHGALVVGSLKANAGHTEPGAGLAGAVKLVVGLQDEAASPNAQLHALNPHVGGALRKASCGLALGLGPVGVEGWRGGVSSFGYAGTLAHTVLRHAGGDGGAAAVQRPLAYRRRSFPWRDPPHPFAQRVISSSDGAAFFRSPVAGALHALVADHVVQGRVIFPGAAYLEVVRAAGATALDCVYFLQPLAAEAPGLVVECAMSNARFEVRTSDTNAFEDATVHCSGATATDTVRQRVDHARLRTLSRAADVGALYDGFDTVGLQYGPGYRTLINAWGGASDALARLRALSSPEPTHTQAASLDDALCTSAAIASSGGGGTRLPFAVDDALLQGAPGELWAVRSRNLQALSTAPYA
jgi:acyl transferase domain-containing protein